MGLRSQNWNAVYKLLTDCTDFPRSRCWKAPAAPLARLMPGPSPIPDKVSCIYAENPVLRCTMTKAQPLDNLAALAKAGVPMLHVCGSLDPMLQSQTRAAENTLQGTGRLIDGHHSGRRGTLPHRAARSGPGCGFHFASTTTEPGKARTASAFKTVTANCQRLANQVTWRRGVVQTWVARPEVLRRAWRACKRSTPFGVPQGVPPKNLGS